MADFMRCPSFKDEKNTERGCCASQKDVEVVTIKMEIESDQEELSETAAQEPESMDNAERMSLFEGNPPVLKIFLKEEPVDNEEKNCSVVNYSCPAEEEALKLKEEIKLEDIEFQSVGPLSTEVVYIKTEDYDCDELSHEEETNSSIATDDSASEEEDPLEVNDGVQGRVSEEEVGKNLEERRKKKNQKCGVKKSKSIGETQCELNYKCLVIFI